MEYTDFEELEDGGDDILDDLNKMAEQVYDDDEPDNLDEEWNNWVVIDTWEAAAAHIGYNIATTTQQVTLDEALAIYNIALLDEPTYDNIEHGGCVISNGTIVVYYKTLMRPAAHQIRAEMNTDSVIPWLLLHKVSSTAARSAAGLIQGFGKPIHLEYYPNVTGTCIDNSIMLAYTLINIPNRIRMLGTCRSEFETITSSTSANNVRQTVTYYSSAKYEPYMDTSSFLLPPPRCLK